MRAALMRTDRSPLTAWLVEVSRKRISLLLSVGIPRLGG